MFERRSYTSYDIWIVSLAADEIKEVVSIKALRGVLCGKVFSFLFPLPTNANFK